MLQRESECRMSKVHIILHKSLTVERGVRVLWNILSLNCGEFIVLSTVLLALTN